MSRDGAENPMPTGGKGEWLFLDFGWWQIRNTMKTGVWNGPCPAEKTMGS